MSMLRLVAPDDSAREMAPPEGDYYAQISKRVTSSRDVSDADHRVFSAIVGFTSPGNPTTWATDSDIGREAGGKSRSSVQESLVRLDRNGWIGRRGAGRSRVITVLTLVRSPRNRSMHCPESRTDDNCPTVRDSRSNCPESTAQLSENAGPTVRFFGPSFREEREKTKSRAPASSAQPVEGAPPTPARDEDKPPDPPATVDTGELADLVRWAKGSDIPGLTRYAIGELAKLGLAAAQPRREQEPAPAVDPVQDHSRSCQPVAALLRRTLTRVGVTHLPTATSDRPRRMETPAPGDSAKNPGAGEETSPPRGESIEHASGRSNQKDRPESQSPHVPSGRRNEQTPDTPIIR